MRIDFCKSIEPENRAEIEKYLNPFLWLVPKWCQKIVINMFGSNGECSISTRVDYEYRAIYVDFYSSWLNELPETKQDHVVHECIHFFVNNLYNQAYAIAETAAGDNDKFKDLAKERLRIAVESVTQDLAYAILEKFNDR